MITSIFVALFNNLLRSALIGAALIGTAAKSGKYSYYECNARFKKGKECCEGIRLGKDKLERFVVDRINENILTEENLKQLVTLINKELLETSTRCEKQLLQTGF